MRACSPRAADSIKQGDFSKVPSLIIIHSSSDVIVEVGIMEWIACKESVEGDKRIMPDERRDSQYLEGEKPKRGGLGYLEEEKPKRGRNIGSLGQCENPEWTLDAEALVAFERFRQKLLEIESNIMERNKDKRLKNRNGPVNMPYTLLFPNTSYYSREAGLKGNPMSSIIQVSFGIAFMLHGY
ncbi:Linoleate 9S-lipoxygenase 5 [Glycine soja]